LEQYATVKLFAETLKNPLKNIADCLPTYEHGQKKSGCNGFADDEIFNMAIHYYDEQILSIRQTNKRYSSSESRSNYRGRKATMKRKAIQRGIS
jgi:hypothetical protein